MNCIFCHREPPDIKLTDEHIFPEALGGRLVLKAVCKECNDQLGRYVDVLLTDDFFVQMLRLGLCIPNSAGRIPTPLYDAIIKSHPNRRGTYFHPSREGVGQVRLRPLVEHGVSPDGRSFIKVLAEPSEAEEILRKLTKRAARRGQRVRVVRGRRETIRRPIFGLLGGGA